MHHSSPLISRRKVLQSIGAASVAGTLPWVSSTAQAAPSPYRDIFAAPLSDGRLQVWLPDQEGRLWTLWKTSKDPNASWTPWQKIPDATGASSIAAAALPNRALQLFIIQDAGFNPPYQKGPHLVTTWKTSPDSSASWSDWQMLLEMEGQPSIGIGTHSVAAMPLPDGRIQVFVVVSGTNVSRLLTAWKETTDVNAKWSAFTDIAPPGKGYREVTAARLSDGRIQLFVSTGSGILTSWKVSRDPDAAWQPWQPFQRNGGESNLVACSLSDGRPQLWRFDRHGEVWSCWKMPGNASSAWSAWSRFQTASPKVTSLAAAPLSDGRIQVWTLSENGAIHTQWKVSRDPNSAWSGWSAFPHP